MNDLTSLDENDNAGSMAMVPTLAVGMMRAELDQQITTARAYPRSIKQVTDRIFSLATLDDESAAESMYALPRGGKPITGPSIRFAECVKQAYGNCRAAARVVHVDREEKFVEAEGVFHDLETNVATTARVRRRIVDSKGRLYSDDMIIVTGNAACSIALRNAIMGGVPKPLWRRAYEAVQSTIKGDITTLSENRTAAIKAFANYGVKPEQVFAALGVAGGEDITVEHIPVLRGMFGTLKNGEATVEEMFGAVTAPGTAPQALHSGFADAKKAETKKTAAKPAAPAPPPSTQEVALDDDLPDHVKDARPTETGTAQSAEPEPDTSASATDASPGSRGQADASPPASSEPTSGGAAEPDDPLPEEELPEVVTPGYPAPGTSYHLDGETWDGPSGTRPTYKDGKQAGAAGRAAGVPIYEDHAPVAGAPTPEPDQEEGKEAENLPPEFSTYIAAVEAATTWAGVKQAMAAFYTTDLFKGLPVTQQNKVRGDTWDAITEKGLGDVPDHAVDVSAFRLWIEWIEDADAIRGTLRILEQEPAFKDKADAFKVIIRTAVSDRLSALGA